jgi:tRNA-specific 2-thiouridylase
MSGGVDSSVAAVLLVEAGFEVVGVTMLLAPQEGAERGWPASGCCQAAEMAEGAAQVAAGLGIPHYTVDFRAEFERHVVDPFVQAYLAGRTPNPCLDCNREIKFGALLERAQAHGCDYVATGHYARTLGRPGHRRLLWRGLDQAKDQSYVLFDLGQEQLARILLPLGGITKTRVRAVARSHGLITANRPESQEICFVPGDDYRAFLRQRLSRVSFVPGPVVTAGGDIIGRHDGLAFYTVGQRRGLRLEKAGPWYVIALRPDTNAVVVGRAEELLGSTLVAERVSFIPMDWPTAPLRVQAKIRYRSPAVPALVTPLARPADRFPESAQGGRRSGWVRVDFDCPQRAITPGQAVVFYRGEEVTGGGTIVAETPNPLAN